MTAPEVLEDDGLIRAAATGDRAAFGVDTLPSAIDFKWADNLQHPGEVSDFYLSGDVAPEGRFVYRYIAE